MTIGGIVVPIETIVAAFVALAGAVGVLWKQTATRAAATEGKLDECQQEHIKAAVEMGALREKIGHVEGLALGYDKARLDLIEAAETLAKNLAESERAKLLADAAAR